MHKPVCARGSREPPPTRAPQEGVGSGQLLLLQLDEAAVERMETTSVPADLPRRETHRLLPARAEAEHQAEARV